MKLLNKGLLAIIIITSLAFVSNSKKSDSIVEGINIGNKAPELTFKNPQGKEISLSSLKGNIVLIDFWASWCGPCRKENPSIVKAYNKYQNAKFKDAKGFEIFSASLDKNKENWVKAIKQDHLAWDYHVSDLKGWSSEAANLYQVNSIPTNWLIDANGIIIGKSLKGEKLHLAIDKHVKSLK